MGKPHEKRSRRQQRMEEGSAPHFEPNAPSPRAEKRDRSALKPQTEAQADYIAAIRSSVITMGIGPAGTGKTFIAACEAARMLEEGQVERIVATRPAIEAGEHLGFLPGEMGEKFDPYFAPLREVLDRRLGRSAVEGMIRSGRIMALPLAYMRGRSFKDSFVILDEAQNTTPGQMKMFLSRTGENSIVVVDGDPRQSDIPGPNGLVDAMDRLGGLEGVSQVFFRREDIVRSGIVRALMERYEG